MKIPKFLGIISIIVLLPLFALLVMMVLQFAQEIKNKPNNVVVTNITGNSATISWYTNEKTFGNVIYSEKENILPGLLGYLGKKVAYDDRDYSLAVEELNTSNVDAAINKAEEDFTLSLNEAESEVKVTKQGRYYVHSVTILNLDEETRYFFKIGNGFWSWDYTLENTMVSEGFVDSSFKTFVHPETLDAPKPAYGRVYELVRGEDGLLKESGNKDAIVYVKAVKQTTGDETLLLSTLTNRDGGWTVDKSNFRDTKGDIMKGFQDKKDSIIVSAQTGNSEKLSTQDLVWGFDDAPSPFLLTNTLESEVKDEFYTTPWYLLELEPRDFIWAILGSVLSLSALIIIIARSKLTFSTKSSALVVVVFFVGSIVTVGSVLKSPTFANCIEDNNCRDWNERMEAKAETAREEGNYGAAKEYESKKVSQESIEAALQNAYELANTYSGDSTDISKMTRALEYEAQGWTLSAADQAALDKFNELSAADKAVVNQMSVMQRPNGAYSTDLKEDVAAAEAELKASLELEAKIENCEAKSNPTTTCNYYEDGSCICSENPSVAGTLIELGEKVGRPAVRVFSAVPETEGRGPAIRRYTPAEHNTGIDASAGVEVGVEETFDNERANNASVVATAFVLQNGANLSQSYTDLQSVCAKNGLSGDACKTPQNGNDALNTAIWEYKQAQDSLNNSMEVYNSVLNSAKTVEGITESIDELESKLLADAQKLGFSNIDQVMNADISPLALVNPFSATEKEIARLQLTANQIESYKFLESLAETTLDAQLYLLGIPEVDTGTADDEESEETEEGVDYVPGTPVTIVNRVNAQESDVLGLSNDYVFYIPESGGYILDVNNSSFGLITEQGVNYSLYYERNGEEGYQAPIDPMNVKDNEDSLVNMKTAKVEVDKIVKTFSISLNKGINMISFPFLPSADMQNPMKASEFLALGNTSVSSVKSITTFDGGKWSGGMIYGDTNSGLDFELSFGKGFLVVANEKSILELPGYEVKSSVPVALSSGWNLVGIHGYAETYTASSLIDSISTVEGLGADNVTYWPTAKGRYEGLQKSEGVEYGFDFPIRQDLGYFIRINKFEPAETTTKSLIWNPGGTLHGVPGSN